MACERRAIHGEKMIGLLRSLIRRLVVKHEAIPFWDQFAPETKRVVDAARKEALALNHGYLGTEHLLLAFAKQPSGIGAAILTSLSVDFSKLTSAVETIVVEGPGLPGRVQITPRARSVLEYSLREAQAAQEATVKTEHLLVAFLREEQTVAALVLSDFGVSLEKVQREIEKWRETDKRRPAVME